MARRHTVTFVLPRPEPEPAYDLGLHQELLKDAEAKSRGPLGPADLKQMYAVAERRGSDWCTAVLGYGFSGIDRSTSVEGFVLILADELGITPPLPARIVQARQQQREREELRARQARERREREQRRWDAALAAAGVEMTVRENTRHSGVKGSLRHAAPKDDLVSGRSRRHPADRGLCETPGRSNPLVLSEPVDAPANCVRCLDYLEKVRPLDAPAPPTPTERGLLELVKAGAVFTVYVRTGRTIRDTSERSKGAWGHFGRKVDAGVDKLQAKGWVVKDGERSATQAGHLGDRWRLTDAGTAALER